MKSEKIKGENKMKELKLPLNLQFFAEGAEGENESVNAEQTEDVNEVESSTTEEVESTSQDEESNVQSAEENAKYAAARRRAEAEFAEKQRRMDEQYARMFKDYENPITHEPIKNAQDYLNALDAQNKLKMQEDLQSKGIDPNFFEDMVNRQVENNPLVQQAQQVMQMEQQRQVQSALENDMKIISTLNPNLKSVNDVMNLPNSDKMISLVQSGLSLADAYKVANFDDLMAGKSASAKQAALNTMNGTSHLNQTDGLANADSGEVEIPQNELDQWKRAFPHASLAELRKKYNQSL
jgi:hypothetical protein